MKSVLVIGGNGFIGRHLIEGLKLGLFEVSALVRTLPEFPLEKCEYFKVDDLLKRQELRFDVIINVAMLRSAPSQNQQLIYNSNFLLPFEVIKQFSHSETVVINTSTYIQHFLGVPNNPVEPYGIAKCKLSVELEGLAQKGDFILKDLYLFTLFGEGDRIDRFLPNLIRGIKSHEDLYLTGGDQLLNLLNVTDLVPILIAEAGSTNSNFQQYRVWDNNYTKLSDLVLRLVGERKIKIFFGAKDYNGHEMFEPWPFVLEVYPKLATSEDSIKVLESYIQDI